MRAICVLKVLLLMGLVADAGATLAATLAIEDATQNRIANGPVIQGRTMQSRLMQSRPFADVHAGRTADAQVGPRDAAQTRAIARPTVRTFHPRLRPRLLPETAESDLRLASLTPEEVLRADLFATDRFSTDRGVAFAPPAAAQGRIASDHPGGSFVPDERQRNIALLRKTLTTPQMRSATDIWLMALVGLMLVVYQLCRKHRFLRPQPFTV